jgi:hypothetical protein
MLSKQTNSTIIKSSASVCSSQLDFDPMHCAIKEAYFELDKSLKKVVKDDSGCVCVSLFFVFFQRENIRSMFIDYLSNWSRNDLFN